MSLVSQSESVHRFRRGDRVQVRSLEEILATLDADGALDRLPFMPEMARYCGQQFTVYRRSDKTCVEGDPVRQMNGAVLLEGLRCDGADHEGCQRQCLIIWKEAWLKPAEAAPAATAPVAQSVLPDGRLPITKGDVYYCQSTELQRATRPIRGWGLHLYFRELVAGEITFWRLLRILVLALYNKARRHLGVRRVRQLSGEQTTTDPGRLDLEPGQWVEVRSREEIAATLNAEGKNRGMTFEPEMVQHCGKRYRVATCVYKIIVEQTGKMVQLNNTVILEGVTCQGTWAKNCPRNHYFYWREIWLRRADPPSAAVRLGDACASGAPCPGCAPPASRLSS
jgi:hypothetical protein